MQAAIRLSRRLLLTRTAPTLSDRISSPRTFRLISVHLPAQYAAGPLAGLALDPLNHGGDRGSGIVKGRHGFHAEQIAGHGDQLRSSLISPAPAPGSASSGFSGQPSVCRRRCPAQLVDGSTRSRFSAGSKANSTGNSAVVRLIRPGKLKPVPSPGAIREPSDSVQCPAPGWSRNTAPE